LRSDNRWVKLAKLILWEEFEGRYAKTLKRSGLGNPAKSIQVAFGSLIMTLPQKPRPFSKRVQFVIEDKKENKNERQTVQRSI